jgi:hypothetical protein
MMRGHYATPADLEKIDRCAITAHNVSFPSSNKIADFISCLGNSGDLYLPDKTGDLLLNKCFSYFERMVHPTIGIPARINLGKNIIKYNGSCLFTFESNPFPIVFR